MKMISGHAALSLCLALSATICGVQATSTPDSLYYTAGVVEFRPTITDTSINILNEHLEAYMDIVGSDEATETDIIVFPEGTLNNMFTMTYVPAASENVKPCDDTNQIYEDFLVTLSCVARTKRKYLVINLTEKENCTENASIDPRPCASNGLNVYNTNVVFDREGRVISRYRKTHLYNEAKNSTLEPEFGIFETDFGVTFGHFICFDMLFYTPAQEMVREKNITNFILTSMFYSELPFLTGVQLQQSWSMGNNVNLLAAGASYPESGITGTGIFAGLRGTLASVMATGKGLRKLYVAQVPKQPLAMQSTTQKESSQAINDLQRTLQAADIKLMQDPNMTDFENWRIDTAGFRQTGHICMNGFCCSYNLTMERKEDANVPGQKLLYYKYRVGVFNGKRTYGNGATNDVRVCGLYTCTDNTQSSCGQLLDIDAATAAGFLVKSNFRFRSIELKASLVKNDYLLIMPSTLNDDLLPLNAQNIDWNVTESDINYAVQITSTSTLDNLLTFGIYAQYYEQKIKDDDDGNSADKRTTISVTALLMCTATLLLVGWRRDAH